MPEPAGTTDRSGAAAAAPDPAVPVPSTVDTAAAPGPVPDAPAPADAAAGDGTAAAGDDATPTPADATPPDTTISDAAASGDAVPGAAVSGDDAVSGDAASDVAAPDGAASDDGAVSDDGVSDAAASGDAVPDGAVAASAADGAEAGPDGDGAVDGGELDELVAVLDEGTAEPRRHWLRYPGLFGALTVVAMVILVPCGAAILFFNGAFADAGRFGGTPDACSVLDARTAARLFGDHLERVGHTGTGDDSTCEYRGSAAVRGDASVTLTLTRYGTKGPLSAPRMAHGGMAADSDDGGARRPVPGVGDEAVALAGPTGVTVYARVSNVVLTLQVSSAAAGEPAALRGARTVAAGLR